MSGAGIQFARTAGDLARPKRRRLLGCLLHALNQPLTGLQCSMELALASPQRTEQYAETLREGLELVSRMRILVEAMHEVADMQPSEPHQMATVRLDRLLGDTAAELLPVASEKGIGLQVETTAPLVVRGDYPRLTGLMFRTLESALSLSNRDLHIVAAVENGRACLTLSWTPGPAPEDAPLSRQELGLLVAQAGWEQAGATWTEVRTESRESRVVTLPVAKRADNETEA